jgi:phenylacetate-CoA ligase
MCEIAGAASECEHGSLHIWPDVGIVEVLDENNQPVPPGITGRLVLTGLLNSEMPLIRYEVGDWGALADSNRSTCPCGRTLSIIESLEGRSDDLILTRDGRKIGRLDPVFKGEFPLHEAQIIQESLDEIRVRYVPLKTFNAKHAEELQAAVKERLGNMQIVLEKVDNIPRGPNGKFRAVISNLNDTSNR